MADQSPEPPYTLKHKRSRILGQSSQTSLHSKYQRDADKASPQNPQLVTKESSPASQLSPTKQSTDSWSLWPKRNVDVNSNSIVEGKSTDNNDDNANCDISIRSNKSTTNLENHIADKDQVNKNINNSNNNNTVNNWMSWNKASNLDSSNQVDAQPTASKSNKDQVKATADSVADPAGTTNAQKASRSTSWSFWNNSTEPVSNSNKLLASTSDAILFESKEINPSQQEIRDSSPKRKQAKQRLPNRVVPLLDDSLPYNSTTNSFYSNFNALKHNLGFTVTPPSHLFRHSSTPKSIKKVLIIGVHGFFPTKVLRPLIGEPTGTSLKFTTEVEKCIWRWAKRDDLNIEVQKIALEKDGKILDRVDFFYAVLEKWKEELKGVDFIYVAAHSQGCPVSIILLAKLISNGIIDPSKVKIALLAMAGINNGPFYGVDQKLVIRAYSTIESDSLMELFHFQNFGSFASKEFLRSIKILLSSNVKISFVGSINDQLVPLYSSHALHVRHPNIFRATYIDGDSNTPDFVTRAISIANHMHNVGLSDHGLIKEISNVLAGPLTGGGHSKIYNDPQVYDLALNFALYTTDVPYDIPLYFKPYSIEQLGLNPYHLPWCMRGLLYEAKQHFKDGGKEIDSLFKEFDDWKPESKALKDMKYRLNGLKSKL